VDAVDPGCIAQLAGHAASCGCEHHAVRHGVDRIEKVHLRREVAHVCRIASLHGVSDGVRSAGHVDTKVPRCQVRSGVRAGGKGTEAGDVDEIFAVGYWSHPCTAQLAAGTELAVKDLLCGMGACSPALRCAA
jgi:hypothetical protein